MDSDHPHQIFKSGDNLAFSQHVKNVDFCMERLCDAALFGKATCHKVCISVADETYWRVIKLIPFKKGTALFINSRLNKNTCACPDILDEYHCMSSKCTKNIEKSRGIPFEPTLLAPANIITAGEINRNGVFVSFRHQNHSVKQDFWGEEEFSVPQAGETCFQPKFENAYYNPEVARHCIYTASVRRIPQCYKLRYKNPQNTPETPEYTIVRLIPAGPNCCYFYEYLPTEQICSNLKDMRCLQGPSQDCLQFKRACAA